MAQASISEGDVGVRDCAALLVDLHRDAGFTEAELAETPGLPGVWAYLDAGKPHTLCVYAMFDTAPVGGTWSRNPFGADVEPYGQYGNVLFGKGGRTKVPYVAFMTAVETLARTGADLPVNVACILDGEEFVGSTHYEFLVRRYAERIPGPIGAIAPATNQGSTGRVNLTLGAKGCAYIDVVASARRWSKGPVTSHVHSSAQGVVHSPPWRLVEALASMSGGPGGTHVAIDGFYDGAGAVPPESRTLLERIVARHGSGEWRSAVPGVAGVGSVAALVDDLEGLPLLERLLYQPTLNINGLRSGYVSVDSPLFTLPGEATARIDIRYAPPQSGRILLGKLRDHLDGAGFEDIEIRDLGTHDSTVASADDAIVRAALDVTERSGLELELWPMRPAGVPVGVFTEALAIPSLSALGLGLSAGAHGSDEYVVIEGDGSVAGFAECIEYYRAYLLSLGDHLP